MENVTNLINESTLLIGALVALIIMVIQSNRKLKVEVNTPPFLRRSSDDVKITERLEILKEYINADRIQIYDFHNGGRYANGRTVLKASCTYEVIRSGINPQQKELMNIPLSSIPIFINALLVNGEVIVKNVEDIKDIMPPSYHVAKDLGLKSFYNVILKSSTGEPIGFLAVQYVKNNYDILSDSSVKEVWKTKVFVEEILSSIVLRQNCTKKK